MPIIVTMTDMNTKIADTKTARAIDIRCKNCFARYYNRLFDKYQVGEDQRIYFHLLFNEVMFKYKSLSRPEIQQRLDERACELIGLDDPFETEKAQSNSEAMGLYVRWKNKVLESPEPFNVALRLAIAGNIMDFGAAGNFDVTETIHKVLSSEFAIDESLALKKKISQAKKILYLGDNAGEIVFDRLFIETIMHNDVTYVVKGRPILNDVTFEDAEAVGMNLVADVVSNGHGAPSTIVKKCSRQFQKLYEEADLIISKGQGNLESLLEYKDPRVFFLLMVKCEVIAEVLEVKKGDFVVYNANY